MNPAILSIILFLFILIMTSADLVTDYEELMQGDSHAVVELCVAFIALTGLGILVRFVCRQQANLQKIKHELSHTRDSLSHTKQKSEKLVGDLSKIIQDQFNDWLMTPSEKEVALLLLKGLTLAEIAVMRDTKEKTVRQQASGVYKKAGLSGRHELVAYFFEDFLK
ncbi:MAG: helix-turn-helix transcriptional regulator [Pontibacterium sp.]